MKRILSLVLAALLVFNAALFSAACGDPEKSARNIVAAGYDVVLALDAAARSAKAFNDAGRLSNAKYKSTLIQINKLKFASAQLNAQFDKLPFIDPANKLEVLNAIQDFSNELGSLLGGGVLVEIDSDTQSQVRRWAFVVSTLLDGIKISVAAIQTPTPLAKVLVGNETAKKVKGHLSKGFTDADAAMVKALSDIGSNFTAKLIAQRGQTIETLRAWRTKATDDLTAFISAEVTRLGS